MCGEGVIETLRGNTWELWPKCQSLSVGPQRVASRLTFSSSVLPLNVRVSALSASSETKQQKTNKKHKRTNNGPVRDASSNFRIFALSNIKQNGIENN